MFDIPAAIERMNTFCKGGSLSGTRAAILEARLAIECVSLDRLNVVADHISPDDLRRWKPKDVLDFLAKQVDSRLLKGATLSIGTGPIGIDPMTRDDFEAQEWQSLGRQVELDPKVLSKLWQKCSSHLHANLGNRSEDEVLQAMRRTLSEATAYLEKLSEGTLIGPTLAETVTFSCECGSKVKRKATGLKTGSIVQCPMPDCFESFQVEQSGEEFSFSRRCRSFVCPGCSEEHAIPQAQIDMLRGDQHLIWRCVCGSSGIVKHEQKILSKRGND